MLEQLIQTAKVISKEIVESGQIHQPIIMIMTPNGVDIALLQGEFRDSFQSDMSVILGNLNAHAYVFIDEVWVTKLPSDSPWSKKVLSGELRVSELPPDDRSECLGILAVENGKQSQFWQAKITQTDFGRYLGEWEQLSEPFTGRLILERW